MAPAPQGDSSKGGSDSQDPTRESGRGSPLCIRKNRRCPATPRIKRRGPTTTSWRSTAPSSLPQSKKSCLKPAGSSAYMTTPPAQSSFRRCSPPTRKTRKPKRCWNFRRSNSRNEGSTRRLQSRILPVRCPAVQTLGHTLSTPSARHRFHRPTAALENSRTERGPMPSPYLLP